MNRHSSAFEAIPETPILPFPSTTAAEPQRQPEPRPFQTVNRVAVIEPGIGSFRIVYRDEHGHPLLDWECDYRVTDEDRQWMRKMQQGIGDQLPATSARLAPLPLPRLMP